MPCPFGPTCRRPSRRLRPCPRRSGRRPASCCRRRGRTRRLRPRSAGRSARARRARYRPRAPRREHVVELRRRSRARPRSCRSRSWRPTASPGTRSAGPRTSSSPAPSPGRLAALPRHTTRSRTARTTQPRARCPIASRSCATPLSVEPGIRRPTPAIPSRAHTGVGVDRFSPAAARGNTCRCERDT